MSLPQITILATLMLAIFTQVNAAFDFDFLKNDNEKHVADQLILITDPTVTEAILLTNVFELSQEEMISTFNKLSGSQYVELQAAAQLSTRQFIRRLYDPIRSIITSDMIFDPCDYCYSVWTEGNCQRSFVDGENRAHGFKSGGYAVSGGFQARFCQELMLGAAVSYDSEHYNFNIGGSSAKNKTMLGALYALYRPINLYIFGNLVFGNSKNQLKRSVFVGSVLYQEFSKPKSVESALYVEGGFDYWWESQCFPLLLQPFLGLEAGCYYYKKIDENGTSPLTLYLKQKSYATFDTRLGIHISSNTKFGLSAGLDLAWQYRCTNLQNARYVEFQDFGSVFKLQGAGIDRNAIDGALNITQRIDQFWSVYATAWLEKRSNLTSYSLIGGVSANW